MFRTLKPFFAAREIFKRTAGCNPNTQIFLEVKRGDDTCHGTIVDDESIRQGASQGHMSALGVVYRKVSRDRSVLYIDDILLKCLWIVRCSDVRVLSMRKRTFQDDIR